jgi:uncharacterized protein (DUF1330 family)
MTVTLCVLLTPVGGKEADLVTYEDLVLPMLERHGGHMLHRVRRADGGNDPYEVHLIDFPDDDAVAAYLEDPERLALSAMRDDAILATRIIRVDPIPAP